MNCPRKLLGFLTVVLLMGFALPAFADGDDEKFKVVLSPLTLSSSGAQSITATVTNLTGDDDKIKSFKLTAPTTPPGVTITTATSPSITQSNIAIAAGVVSVKSVSISHGQSVVLTLGVTYPSPAACGSTSFAWQAKAWSESNFSDNQFNLDSSSKLTQTLSVTCYLMSFVSQPANALAGAIITNSAYNNPPGQFVQVKLLVNGNPAPSTTVALTSSCPSLTNASATSNSNGLATFNQLTSGAGSNCKLTAMADAFASVDSNLFNVTASDGTVACGNNLDFAALNPSCTNQGDPNCTNPARAGFAKGMRGANNKDSASSCASTPFDFTNNVAPGGEGTTPQNLVSLKWDTASQPGAAFFYTITWLTELVDATGFPVPRRPKVAWEVNADNTPKFVLGVACLSSSLPAQIGTLSSSIGTTETVISISFSPATPVFPFPITIGAERIQVLSSAGTGSFNVVRNADGYPANLTGHTANAPVMSTPLPIDPNATSPYFNKQAQMCIFMHGWNAVGIEPATGRTQIRYFTSVFDIGDGVMDLE